MSITSYAQNFEDVMLWRALGHIERGFYIDIGAQDPIIDSVSFAFHEHGWQGIHVEPTPHYAELLRRQRPGDTVIQAAVGKGPTMLQFFEIPDTGISTADAVIAAQHRERGFTVHKITVPCIPLADVFKTCAGQEIHWLKIDVEGLEKQVLSSWGSSAARPWIAVVESTLPLTQIETHENWQATLTAYGYTPVYFDGLNRYYVSEAHPELKGAFLAPPNVFDGFTLNGTASAPFHKLIEARHQEKISEILAQVEQQRRSTNSEIERLTLSLASLDRTHTEHDQNQAQREQALAEQTSKAQQELASLLRTQVQREQEVTAQLLAIQQQAAKEKIEQTRSHSEQERALHSQHAQREKALAQQLQANQQELRNLQKDRTKREQVVTAQLLTVQHQGAKEKAELARNHSEQARTLQRQHTEREQALSQQLQAGQEELRRLQQDRALREKEHAEQTSQARQALESLLRNQVQREQEVAAQLLAIQQQAAQEKAELARSHGEQEYALHSQHAEREQALTQQLQSGQEELRRLERDWAQHEKALGKEITARQNEAQALHHAQQLQAQQHDAELITRLDEHKRLIAACAALEAQLKAEILFEQQTSLRLRQLLTEVQQSLATTHASLTWRMTAPLRTLATLIVPKKNLDPASPMVREAEPLQAIMPSISESQLINVQYASIKPIMPRPAQVTMPPIPALASTLDELLACHGQQFVHCAFQTLLGRDPDPEGLSYYLGRLRTGFSKMRIVAQLRLSKEGKAQAAKLPGLDTAIQRYQRGQYLLIGWLFRLLDGTEGNHPTERKLRGIENQIFLLSDENHRRFNQLETAIAGLHHLIVQQTQSVVVDLGGTPKNSLNLSAFTPDQLKAPDGLKQLSPRARDIYFQLKTAAARHAGRTA